MSADVFRTVDGAEEWRMPCGALCCFSPDCACIRCSNCSMSLTTVPPKRRFQCMECEVLPPESTFDSRPEYCECCFSSCDVLHWHRRFLLVDQDGEHVAVERLCGIADLSYISLKDFPTRDGLEKEEACGICCMEFTSEDPATCGVGCNFGHGEGVADAHRGVLDSGAFYHAECRMSWMKSQKTDKYCGSQLPVSCKVCLFQEDCRAWQKDFQRGMAAINAGEAGCYQDLLLFLTQEFQIDVTGFPEDLCKEELQSYFRSALKQLHPQPWLQSLIDGL
ncbi:unnamed protein product [Durusdinium trenchii]|uniref:Uncharacterized protein n=1 Tax=Durusdinium trenchii TaxID=1381693 RepID=A0ABP0MDG5_9DINO